MVNFLKKYSIQFINMYKKIMKFHKLQDFKNMLEPSNY
jgi:hypothetical protein